MASWMQVPEFPMYSVSDIGEVRSDRYSRLLTPRAVTGGRLAVSLHSGGRQRTYSLSRLVCDAFVPNLFVEHSPTPIHLDGDLKNCSAENLHWRPRWFANQHTRQFRLDYPNTRPIFNLDTEELYDGIWDAVLRHGLLYFDMMRTIPRQAPVYPLMQRFDWAH